MIDSQGVSHGENVPAAGSQVRGECTGTPAEQCATCCRLDWSLQIGVLEQQRGETNAIRRQHDEALGNQKRCSL
jgi:hypothetical protein